MTTKEEIILPGRVAKKGERRPLTEEDKKRLEMLRENRRLNYKEKNALIEDIREQDYDRLCIGLGKIFIDKVMAKDNEKMKEGGAHKAPVEAEESNIEEKPAVVEPPVPQAKIEVVTPKPLYKVVEIKDASDVSGPPGPPEPVSEQKVTIPEGRYGLRKAPPPQMPMFNRPVQEPLRKPETTSRYGRHG